MSSVPVLALIGLIVGMAILIYGVYRGINIAVLSIVTSVIILATGGINVDTGITEAMSGVGSMCASLFILLIMGGILGMMYSKSGATASIALTLMKPFANAAPSVRRLGALCVFMLIRVLVGLGGVEPMAVAATMIAVGATLFKDAGIPRRYLSTCMLMATAAACCVSGAPNMINIILEQQLEVSPTDGLLVRSLCLLVYIVVGVIIMYALVNKAVANGETFDAGNLKVLSKEEGKRPNFILSLILIILVFVIYNFCGLSAWVALTLGTAVSVVFFAPYIPLSEGKNRFWSVIDQVNRGSFMVPGFLLMAMLPGFALQVSPAFDWMCTALGLVPSPVLGLLIFCIPMYAVAAQGTPVMAAALALSTFIPNGLSPVAAAIIILWSSTILNTPPNDTGVVITCDMCGTTIKEAYPSIFSTTVMLTFGCTVLAAILTAIGLC